MAEIYWIPAVLWNLPALIYTQSSQEVGNHYGYLPHWISSKVAQLTRTGIRILIRELAVWFMQACEHNRYSTANMGLRFGDSKIWRC